MTQPHTPAQSLEDVLDACIEGRELMDEVRRVFGPGVHISVRHRTPAEARGPIPPPRTHHTPD